MGTFVGILAVIAVLVALMILVFAPDNGKAFALVPLLLGCVFTAESYGTLTATTSSAEYTIKHRDAGVSAVWIERFGSLRRVYVPLKTWESAKEGDVLKCEWQESGLTGSEFGFGYAGN